MSDDDRPLAERFRLRTDDGDPVLAFDDGSEVRLEVTPSEWTHESPKNGAPVDMTAETDYFDQHGYWLLHPERSTLPSIRPEDFPVIEITPAVSSEEVADDE